jgi:hypothetical protein
MGYVLQTDDCLLRTDVLEIINEFFGNDAGKGGLQVGVINVAFQRKVDRFKV